MTGSPPEIGDYRRRALHDGFPIRGRGIRHQDLAVPELDDSRGIGYHAHDAHADPGSYRAAAAQYLAVSLQAKIHQQVGLPVRGGRLRPRLHDVELPVDAILGPFNVHGLHAPRAGAVVTLDLQGVVRQDAYVLIAEAEPAPFGLGSG